MTTDANARSPESWLDHFGADPEPLSRRQTLLFTVVTIVLALSRLVTRAKSLWDWDESLFSLALRHYDVSYHQPHPPGFPGYVGLAKIALLFAGDPFRALQSINLIAGALLFPVCFLFARELRLRAPARLGQRRPRRPLRRVRR